jgi:hypothetical protein
MYDVLVFLSLKGCLKALKAWFENNFLTTGVAVIVLCVIEVRRPSHTHFLGRPDLLQPTPIS